MDTINHAIDWALEFAIQLEERKRQDTVPLKMEAIWATVLRVRWLRSIWDDEDRTGGAHCSWARVRAARRRVTAQQVNAIFDLAFTAHIAGWTCSVI